jgi:hypothetical protein
MKAIAPTALKSGHRSDRADSRAEKSDRAWRKSLEAKIADWWREEEERALLDGKGTLVMQRTVFNANNKA